MINLPLEKGEKKPDRTTPDSQYGFSIYSIVAQRGSSSTSSSSQTARLDCGPKLYARLHAR